MADTEKNTKLYDKIGQFTAMPNSVIDLWHEIGTDAIGLFLYLRYRTNKEGVAFPSYNKINEDTGLSKTRISEAMKILNAFDLLEKKKRFSGSNKYFLKCPPPMGVDTEDTTISPDVRLMDTKKDKSMTPSVVQQSDCLSPTSGLPVVQHTDTNKINFNQTENNQINNVSEEKKSYKRGDIVDGILFFNKIKPSDTETDILEYPVDVQDTLREFLRLWPIDFPIRKYKSKFAQWIGDLRALRLATKEYGLPILQQVHADWKKNTFTVSHPGALCNTVTGKVGELRSRGSIPAGKTQQLTLDEQQKLMNVLNKKQEVFNE